MNATPKVPGFREVPCGICHTPVHVLSIQPSAPGAPELMQHIGAWFCIYEGPPPGMVVCCGRECAERMASGTPVLGDGKTVGQA